MSFTATLSRNLSNLPGWRSSRKIIVIESDDWGSIRMPSKRAYEELKLKGIDIDSGDSYRYNQYDTLASHDDLAGLFGALSKYKDKNGHHPVITAVSLVANPDFEKIRNSGFSEYFYEAFTETLKKYGRENAFDLWKEGIKTHLFVPQFHGREHLNIQLWMNALRANDTETRLAFDHNCWGFNNKHPHNISYQAAFDLDSPDELDYQHQIIADGLQLFEKLHNYKAGFFVPPNGPFNNTLEMTAAENGIKWMSASKIQREALGGGQTKRVMHWLGQRNKHNQRYITRNCFFEPSSTLKNNWVDSCLNDISLAFKWHKPAVISTHRVNYIGAHNPENRDNGLKQLSELLKVMVKKWPEVEYITSNNLGDIMVNE
ncbi:MAG: hypothetical protein K8R68_05940 [Bacteroidales bacterium]|nr:hypothetical protein [Bacteroidales bacterium]